MDVGQLGEVVDDARLGGGISSSKLETARQPVGFACAFDKKNDDRLPLRYAEII
jgi:hypothetical protein